MHYRHRYYDPALGRFISRDPIGIWGDAENLGNAQNYCASDPINRVDPLGLDGWGELGDRFADAAAKDRAAKAEAEANARIMRLAFEAAYEMARNAAIHFWRARNCGSKEERQAVGAASEYYRRWAQYYSLLAYGQSSDPFGDSMGWAESATGPTDLLGVGFATMAAGKGLYAALGAMLDESLPLSPRDLEDALELAQGAARCARRSGLGDLTVEEVERIQEVVEQAGRPLEVVGSAARGERRHVGSDLPLGKGDGTRSDIDYMIPHSSAEAYEDLLGGLPDLDDPTKAFGTPERGWDRIRFEPGQEPRFVPGKK